MLVTRGHFGRFPSPGLNQLQEKDHKPNHKVFRRAMSNEENSTRKLKGRITRPQNKSIVQDFSSVSYHFSNLTFIYSIIIKYYLLKRIARSFLE